VVTRRCPADAARRAVRVTLVVTDNDGVLTDGTVYVAATGEHLKVYSVRDGMGVERLRERGIATGVVTREPPDLIAPRAAKLAVRHLWTGVRDKHAHLGRILDEAAVGLDQLVYIGDDVNDLGILEAIGEVGLTAAPADAMPEVRDAVHYICNAPGGRGAFREVAEWLLRLRTQGDPS
jgi:3-deoxy-D-manno-octulosonate 8-phosphate phosphatase (KDO 8-P phosphatase)